MSYRWSGLSAKKDQRQKDRFKCICSECRGITSTQNIMYPYISLNIKHHLQIHNMYSVNSINLWNLTNLDWIYPIQQNQGVSPKCHGIKSVSKTNKVIVTCFPSCLTHSVESNLGYKLTNVWSSVKLQCIHVMYQICQICCWYSSVLRV